jgi:hypothetical protein
LPLILTIADGERHRCTRDLTHSRGNSTTLLTFWRSQWRSRPRSGYQCGCCGLSVVVLRLTHYRPHSRSHPACRRGCITIYQYHYLCTSLLGRCAGVGQFVLNTTNFRARINSLIAPAVQPAAKRMSAGLGQFCLSKFPV